MGIELITSLLLFIICIKYKCRIVLKIIFVVRFVEFW